MKGNAKPARVLTAADIMNRTIVTVPHRIPLGIAARTFARTNSLVLPAVDEQGKFVGAISAMEVHQWASAGGHYDACASPDWRTMTPGTGRTDEVRWYLMKNPPVVAPETGIPELVELLRKSRVVLVVDNKRRPVGKILAVDMLAVTGPFESQPSEKLVPRLRDGEQVDLTLSNLASDKPLAAVK